MRIALIAAGAGGMYCGSCLRDDALARAMRAAGEDVFVIPTYTPLRTESGDDPDSPIFLGGINVYLQQHSGIFRHTPRWIDGILDYEPLLRAATRNAGDADPNTLVDLTLSLLEGEHGRQKKEIDRLVRFLRDEIRPDIVNLPNALFLGLAPRMRDELGVPIVCSLTGSDVFVDEMGPRDRERVKQAVHRRSERVDAFIATSSFYADYIASYYDLPRARTHVVPIGIDLTGFAPAPPAREPPHRFTIGYLARICRQKGLHLLADAFAKLVRRDDAPQCRLRVAGYISRRDRGYLAEIEQRLAAAGCAAQFEYVGEVDRAAKLAFLQSLDLLSVPTTFLEPKGLYVLEALAAGVPVVQPNHGSFPELIEATGGGVLVEPDNPDQLADALVDLMNDHARRNELSNRGAQAVHNRFSAARMAAATLDIYKELLAQSK
ncbi:MAG: glycosyltransferase family 4 protein [Phycisphaerae bacterium]